MGRRGPLYFIWKTGPLHLILQYILLVHPLNGWYGFCSRKWEPTQPEGRACTLTFCTWALSTRNHSFLLGSRGASFTLLVGKMKQYLQHKIAAQSCSVVWEINSGNSTSTKQKYKYSTRQRGPWSCVRACYAHLVACFPYQLKQLVFIHISVYTRVAFCRTQHVISAFSYMNTIYDE